MAPEAGSRVQTLLGLGLTEYQAKVYLSLLQTGSGTASQLATHSGVPRTRIYSTIEHLHEKGLVKIIPETPTRYRPVAVQDYLRRRAEELKGRADELLALQEAYAKTFAPRDEGVPAPGGNFEVYKGRKNVRDKLVQMWSGAGKSIDFIGLAQSPPRLLGKLYTTARERRAVKVRVRFIFPIQTPHIDRVRDAFTDFQVRFALETPPIDICLVDGREGMLVHRIPDDSDPYEGNDVAIWWDDPAILHARHGLFESAWRDAYSPENPGLALVPAALRDWLELSGVKPKPVLEEMARGLGTQVAASLRTDTVPGILKELGKVFTETGMARVGKGEKNRVFVRCRYHEITGKCPEYDTFCRTFLKTVLQEKLGSDGVEEVTHTQTEGCSVTLR